MKLRQIASIAPGYPFRGKIPESATRGLVAVQMKDVSTQQGISWAQCQHTELTGKRDPDWLQPGDILVAARGNHNYAVQVDHTLTHTGFQAIAAPHFFVITLKNPNQVLPEYLTWLLNQAPSRRYFEQNSEGSFTKSIRRSVLEDMPIAVPPLAKQHSIIKLANTLNHERQIVEQLLRNGEHLMNTIATELLADL